MMPVKLIYRKFHRKLSITDEIWLTCKGLSSDSEYTAPVDWMAN